jgi:CPA2 family monovalent cation:H+ antiporter-2
MLVALAPVIVLLGLGVATIVASRTARASPIVGYILLGLALKSLGVGSAFPQATIETIAQLGVVFLLFDVGLHFSLRNVKEQASDIFAFGPVQVIFGTIGLSVVALTAGIGVGASLLVGLVLSLSSTAVVAQIIAERHMRNCPVGLTATAILVFQDFVAILILVIVGAMGQGGGSFVYLLGAAVLKAALAFGATVAIARYAVSPLFMVIARTRTEEVFTAIALLTALAAAWLTAQIGLSLTLGAFLGGLALSETPYRAVIRSEVQPFRGLLLGFFFVYVGYSLNPTSLVQNIPLILACTAGLLTIKLFTNIGASRTFRWSVPGSTQLGFMLSQGSEFAFVIFSLPPVRHFVGNAWSTVLVASVALSIAGTPFLAELGRNIAGRMRRRLIEAATNELTPRSLTSPVLIIGMGSIGRSLADALSDVQVNYCGIERDSDQLKTAVADGYFVNFGDPSDTRLWESVKLHHRKVTVFTAPNAEELAITSPASLAIHPDLKRFVVIREPAQAQRFEALGLSVIVRRGSDPVTDIAPAIMQALEIPQTKIDAWLKSHRERIAEVQVMDERAIA